MAKKTLYEDSYSAKFYHFGQAALAKTIAFRSLAVTLLSSNERIPAVISGYYSLLHCTISLMYFCPQTIPEETKSKWLASIQKQEDPTGKISHMQAARYLGNCELLGLDHKCTDWFDRGKTLREYFNYAPRMTITKSGEIIFGSLKYSTVDMERFVCGCDEVIQSAICWGQISSSKNGVQPMTIALHVNQLEPFFAQPDLGYIHWLSPKALEEARAYVNILVDLSKGQ